MCVAATLTLRRLTTVGVSVRLSTARTVYSIVSTTGVAKSVRTIVALNARTVVICCRQKSWQRVRNAVLTLSTRLSKIDSPRDGSVVIQ